MSSGQEHLDELDAALDDKDPNKMLRAFGRLARKHVTSAIAYYDAGIPSRRYTARTLRMLALILAVLASVSPLVTSIVVTLFSPQDVHLVRDLSPVSAILATMAVASIAVDRLYGYSNAWMRFVTASLELKALRSAFEPAWASARLRSAAGAPEAPLLESLELLRRFLFRVDEVVRSETKDWVADFRNAISDLDKRVESARDHFTAQAERDASAGARRPAGAPPPEKGGTANDRENGAPAPQRSGGRTDRAGNVARAPAVLREVDGVEWNPVAAPEGMATADGSFAHADGEQSE